MTIRRLHNLSRRGHHRSFLTVRDDDKLAAVRKARKMAGEENDAGRMPVAGKSRYVAESTHQQFEAFPDSSADNLVDGWFKDLESDAVDAGNPMPPQVVIDEAKRIVVGLVPYLRQNADVYTMEEGKIAVEVFGLSGRGFLLICEPGGSALCIVTIGGVSRRARYENSIALPDGFLEEGLQDVWSATDRTLRTQRHK